jgi:Flp pilus assembly protein TadG
MMRRLAQLIGHLPLIRRLRRDERGVSAVEFAFIAPVLILFYFGMAELTQALLADRRSSHVASSIGDLVAQDDNLTGADIADIWKIGAIVMSPFDTTTLQMRVTQISSNAANVATVDWSKNNNWADRSQGSTVTPPAGVISANQSVIMAETVYTYTSTFQYVMKTPVTFTKTYYLRPRRVDKITYTP